MRPQITPPDALADVRARWASLPPVDGELSASAALSSPPSVRPARRSRPERARAAIEAEPARAPSLLKPLFVLVVGSALFGGVLALLQTVVWVMPLFELGVGVAVGLALTPLRQMRGCTPEILNAGRIGALGAVYILYVIGSWLLSPAPSFGAFLWAFFDHTFIFNLHGALTGSAAGFVAGLGLIVAQFFVSLGAATATQHLTHDETLDHA